MVTVVPPHKRFGKPNDVTTEQTWCPHPTHSSLTHQKTDPKNALHADADIAGDIDCMDREGHEGEAGM
jgi:hypothetical protein